MILGVPVLSTLGWFRYEAVLMAVPVTGGAEGQRRLGACYDGR